LRTHLETLTAHNEATFPEPWTVSDAPQEHIKKIMMAIVGIEMVITKLLGKWKVSQNQPSQNQESVSAGLKASSIHDAQAMAALVKAWAKNAR
jgi:transcriptional regulator